MKGTYSEQRTTERKYTELRNADYPDIQRPKTRKGCLSEPRPCPWVSCRHHLYLHVTKYGSVKIPIDHEPWDMEHSCSLDLVDRHPGGMTLEESGAVLGLTRERVRQVEDIALDKIRLFEILERIWDDYERHDPNY